jgi:hypothetical protein
MTFASEGASVAPSDASPLGRIAPAKPALESGVSNTRVLADKALLR